MASASKRAGAGFEAIVIGAGLAGAAFAIELARSGARVLVLERTRQATLKVCGDFLSGEALDLLAYLGLDAAGLGASPVDRLTLATGTHAANARLPFRAAGLSRLLLDEALLGLAERAGASVERGITVTGLIATPGEVTVEAAERRYTAPAAVLATGKHNLRGWPRDHGAVTAFKMQFELTSEAKSDLLRRVQLVLFEGGYVGASMVEGDLATICWQLDTNALQRVGADWRGHLERISAGAPRLCDLLAGAKPATPRAAAVSSLPFGYVRRSVIAEAIYAVGDQLAVIPAFTGDGTSIALASGIRAASALLAGESADGFQRDFAQSLKRQFALAKAVSLVFRSGPTRRLAIGLMASLPAIASGVARATRLNLAAPSAAS